MSEEWLRRAKSNLERARKGKLSEDILYEDLCFDCQQVAEKSFYEPVTEEEYLESLEMATEVFLWVTQEKNNS